MMTGITAVWADRGSRPTIIKQTEYEWLYLFASVNPMTGESSALRTPTVNTDYMNEHLHFISEPVGKNKHVVLVMDQAGWHVAKALKIPSNITLYYLPAYSPELNPIERVWTYLKSHYLSNRVFDDYDDLFAATGQAWNLLTEDDLKSICRTTWITREVQV